MNQVLVVDPEDNVGTVVQGAIAKGTPVAVAITHPLGRCQIRPDLRMTRRFPSGTGRNPNVAGVVVIDRFREEGCTAEAIAHDISVTRKPIATVNIRRDGGAISAQAKATCYAAEISRQISDIRRERVTISKLILGTECGTSDTASDLASNPATGACRDRLVSQGGQAVLAECTEWMGCEDFLTDRAASPEIAEAILAGVADMEARAMASGEDIRGSQPTGDNILGGLTTIEERSMGAVKKGGTSPVVGYLEIACGPPSTKSGLYVLYGPGHGAESISNLAAAGCQVTIFSSGGGHTSSHPIMPTIKVTGNRESYLAMSDTVDLDISAILRGELTLDQAGQDIYEELIVVCSGRRTKSEAQKDENSFAIHRVGSSI